MIIFMQKRNIEQHRINYESVETYNCVRMMIRYSIVTCIKYRDIAWTKAEYADVPADTPQLPTQLQWRVWSKHLRDRLRYGLSFKKTHPRCCLVL